MELRFWHCLLLLVGLVGCGTDTATRRNDFLPLTSIEIISANPEIANLTSTQFTATGNFSGQFTRDITADVAWTSNDQSIATVANLLGSEGRATAVSPGVATISAELDGVVAGFDLRVTSATITAITLEPLTPSVPKGLRTQFSATGLFSDSTSQDLTTDVLWASTDSLIAEISNDRGREGSAAALEVGTVDISASFDGLTETTPLTVSPAILQTLTLAPADASLVNLAKGAFTATGQFSDNSSEDLSTQVSWISSDPAVAAIDSDGQATTFSTGLTTITASLNGVTGTSDLTVTGGELTSISIEPALSLQLVDGTSGQLKAIGLFDNNTSREITEFVTWDSADQLVASIANTAGLQGRISTVGPGTATLTATFDTLTQTSALTVVTASLNSLSLDPATPTTAVEASTPLIATGNFSGGITQDLTLDVTWASSAVAVATISNAEPDRGRVTGVNAGTTTISADFGSAPTASVVQTVTNPTLLSLEISPVSPQLVPGEPIQLSVTANYQGGATQDLTRDAVWASSDLSVATFLSPTGAAAGLLTGIDSGSAEITASFAGQTARVNVDVR